MHSAREVVGAVVMLVRRSGAVLNGVLPPGEADARVAASAGLYVLTRTPGPAVAAPAARAPGLIDAESDS